MRATGNFREGCPAAPETMHLLFCADRPFFRHAAVAAVSAASATRGPLQVHLLTCDSCPEEEARFRAALAPFAHVGISVHRVPATRLEGLFVDRHLSPAAYLRFLAPEVLPEAVQRVLYLDCDLIVLDDVAQLLRLDLQGRAVAAAPDLGWKDAAQATRFRTLGIPLDRPYVNSGVLLMDLGRWRRDGLSQKLFDYVARHGSLLLRHDQDALNAVLADDIHLLDRRWNLQVLLLSPWAKRALPEDRQATVAARRDPAILHFSTADKPWNFRVWTRRRELYFRFRARTPWSRAVPEGLSAAQAWEYDLARRLLRLGLDLYLLRGAALRLRRILLARMERGRTWPRAARRPMNR